MSVTPGDAPVRPAYIRDSATGLYYKIGGSGGSGNGGGGGGSGHEVQDEGIAVPARSGLNFVGAGVTVTDNAGNLRTDVTIPGGGGGSGHEVQDEGVALTARSGLNFIGAGVTVTDNAGSLRTDVTIPGVGGTGTGVALIVASSIASTAVKASAYSVCDGTADNVEIQAALNAVKAKGGGFVQLTEGTYNLAAGLTIAGSGADTYDDPTIGLIGVGMHSTRLACAVNISGLALTNTASVVVRDLGFSVSGTGSGITSTKTAGPLYQAFWDSEFTNLYFTKVSGTHTGWAMDLGAPFRSTFSNIEVFDLHNGIHLYSQHADFNPGDSTFTRMFIEMDNVAGSVGLKVDSPTGMGTMNQCVFTMCEFIDAATGGTAILLSGNGQDGSAWNFFTGINIEQFSTLIDIQYGSGNRFDLNYVEAAAAGTFFKFGALTSSNHIRSTGMAYVGAKTNMIVNDASTDPDSPNIIENVYIGVDAGGVANATVTTTRITGMAGYNDGTLAAPLGFQRTPVVIKSTTAPLDTTAIWVDIT